MDKPITSNSCPTFTTNQSLQIMSCNKDWGDYFEGFTDLRTLVSDLDQFDSLKKRLANNAIFPFHFELSLKNAQGKYFNFLWIIDKTGDDQYKFYGHDIGHRRDIETRYERIYHSTTDAVMLLGAEKFTDCNQATLEIFKIDSVEDFTKFHPVDLSPEFQPDGKPSVEKANRMIQIAFEKGRNFFEWMHRDSQGNDFLCEVLLSRVEINGQYYLQASVRDISDRVKMQKEVDETRVTQVNAARLASLGEMAGGIAHEINNPMAIIRGQAEFLQRHVNRLQEDQAEPLMKGLNKIVQTVDRITKIIRGLRAVSRDPSHDPMMDQDFVEIIHDTLSLFEEKLKVGDIGFIFQGDQKRVIVSCRPAEIAQVILNLMNNSYDAIKGTKEPWIHLKIVTVNNKMIMSVSDSGKKIPAELADKIFEPFYTTKEVGKGTGLGLSISKNIIERHGGTLVLNKKAEHTTFEITLPMIREE